MSRRSYTKGSARHGYGGATLKAAKALNLAADAIWTEVQREILFRTNLKVKSIDLARQAVDNLGDDLCILFLELNEAGVSKGRICEVYGIANVTLNNMLVQGDSIRALRAVEGK